jgi:hypothetical protein
MRRITILILAAAALVTTGCVGMTATPAVQGKAWVVDGSMFGSSMYNCEVKNGEPVCWEVEQVEAE